MQILFIVLDVLIEAALAMNAEKSAPCAHRESRLRESHAVQIAALDTEGNAHYSESTAAHVDLACQHELYELGAATGTPWEDGGKSELALLGEAQDWLDRAGSQLAGLWSAVEMHVKLEKALAGLGVALGAGEGRAVGGVEENVVDQGAGVDDC